MIKLILARRIVMFVMVLQFIFLLPVWSEDRGVLVVERANIDALQNQIKAKIEALDVNKAIDETEKKTVLVVYQSAKDNLANAGLFLTKTEEFEKSVTEAPSKTKKFQQELEQSKQKAKQNLEDFSVIPGDELEQRLVLEKNKSIEIENQIKTLENEVFVQNDRPKAIRDEILATQQAIEAGQKGSPDVAQGTGSKLEAEALQFQESTLKAFNSAKLKMLTAESTTNSVRVALLKAELQVIYAQKEALKPIIDAIEKLVNQRRQQEAISLENELNEAENGISEKPPIIQATTRENIQYSRDLQTIIGKIDRYNDLKNSTDTTSTQIETDFKNAEKKIALAGLSPVLGKILREQRRNLTGPIQALLDTEAIQNEMAMASLSQFKVEDKLKQLSGLDNYLNNLLATNVSTEASKTERLMMQAELRVLLNNQLELLNKLSSSYNSFLRTLGEYDFAKQQLVIQSDKFAKFLDERLLWVPSSEPINAAFFTALYRAVMWFLSPLNWFVLAKDAISIADGNKPLLIFVLLIVTVLPKLRLWAKAQLKITSANVSKLIGDNFSTTLKALGYTLILEMPLAVLLYLMGWYLSSNPHIANFSKAVGVGLQNSSIPLLVLQLYYRMSALNGVFNTHFRWHEKTTRLLRRQLAWLRFIIVPSVFFISSTSLTDDTSDGDSLGRLGLIVALFALAVFFAKVFNPVSGVFKKFLTADSHSVIAKLRFIWYPLIVLVPVVIVCFAVAGYYLSALELQQKLAYSTRYVFIIVIIHGLIIRWLSLVNRELARKNSSQKRKVALAEKQNLSKTEIGDDIGSVVEEQIVDISTINSQTLKLLSMVTGFAIFVGFWMIWSNILPAFSFLENVVLWQHLVTVDGQESYQPINMMDLLLVGLYVFILVVSVRNFPGLMEVLIFSRLSMAAGGRYAINQLARYFLITIGFICIANQLGGSWSQVQWLVAALGVGLGFGLQEIFANLVSGIILLFERPIRVGDTVTINSVSGRVVRIQMRATTIMDWDHKELIVPNKTFITNQFINWTLTDSTTRIVIPIKVAYGADVTLVHQLMLQAAKATPLVLEEPTPNVLFIGMVDSVLEFSIMVFVKELGHRGIVANDLLIKLEKLFREHAIDLPFINREGQVVSVINETND